MVKKLTANGPDESLNERVRAVCIRNAFDLMDIKDAEIGRPSTVGEQRVMVRAEILWGSVGGDGRVEHST